MLEQQTSALTAFRRATSAVRYRKAEPCGNALSGIFPFLLKRGYDVAVKFLALEAEHVCCLRMLAVVPALLATALCTAETSQLTSDQNSVLEDARAYAVQYSQQLPDFICTQITHREVSKTQVGILGAGATSRNPIGVTALSKGTSGSDVIEEQLTYVGGKESYEVLTVDGRKMPGMTHMLLAGAVSSGEFGSVLTEVFDPKSRTTFTWNREANLHGRHVYVYGFKVPKESGTALIDKDTNKALLASITGQVFIDPVTFDVLQINSRLNIPADFPIHLVERKVEYAAQQIAGKSYSLPLRSQMRMEDNTQSYYNEIEFRNYHHFTSESTIHLGDVASH